MKRPAGDAQFRCNKNKYCEQERFPSPLPRICRTSNTAVHLPCQIPEHIIDWAIQFERISARTGYLRSMSKIIIRYKLINKAHWKCQSIHWFAFMNTDISLLHIQSPIPLTSSHRFMNMSLYRLCARLFNRYSLVCPVFELTFRGHWGWRMFRPSLRLHNIKSKKAVIFICFYSISKTRLRICMCVYV
jgi:hypothetical protein